MLKEKRILKRVCRVFQFYAVSMQCFWIDYLSSFSRAAKSVQSRSEPILTEEERIRRQIKTKLRHYQPRQEKSNFLGPFLVGQVVSMVDVPIGLPPGFDSEQQVG